MVVNVTGAATVCVKNAWAGRSATVNPMPRMGSRTKASFMGIRIFRYLIMGFKCKALRGGSVVLLSGSADHDAA